MQNDADPAALFNRAVQLHQAGRLSDAEELYRRILNATPAAFGATHLLGVARFQRGYLAEALTLIDEALRIDPRSAHAHANYGLVLRSLRRFDESLASYDRSVALAPRNPDTLTSRGDLLLEMGRYTEAITCYDAALAIWPNHADILVNRGHALRMLGRPDEALTSLEAALAANPNHVEGLNNRGTVLRDMKRLEESLASYDRALALKPGHVEALNNRGAVLQKLSRLPEALHCFDATLAISPNHANALFNRGVNLREQGQLAQALSSFDAAIAADPRNADFFYQHGCTLQIMERWRDAIVDYEKAIALDPTHRYAPGGLASAALHVCDWNRVNEFVSADDSLHSALISPVTALALYDDPALQRSFAERTIRDRIGSAPSALWDGRRYRHDRIRLAYLSADFRQHPVAFQLAKLFESHDRQHFEVHALSLGPDDGSPMRARLSRAFDQFHDAWGFSNLEAAQRLRDLEIDIVVDLGGHTFGARPEILSYRPAPVQVGYLGYAGTTGADFIDYIIADRIVAPFEHALFYSEKIVHLPDSFWPNDSRHQAAAGLSRAEAGLPERGFIFCAFHNHWKITAALFDIWMRLLNNIPGSILWLKAGGQDIETNLRKAAQARGIDPARLLFAQRTAALEDHLARLGLAGIFLDTLPYNAHATASDALWAGVPLLTCRGNAFAGRVGASLLDAIGLPELVTENLQDYEKLAAALACDPARLAGLRARLELNKARAPLFDIARHRRHLEAAYTQMWNFTQRGEAPHSFAVPADSGAA